MDDLNVTDDLDDLNINDDLDGTKLKHNICLPFVSRFSNNIKHDLKHFDINVIFKVVNKLDSIIKRGKDLLTNVRKTGIVYKIECNDCTACYVE